MLFVCYFGYFGITIELQGAAILGHGRLALLRASDWNIWLVWYIIKVTY